MHVHYQSEHTYCAEKMSWVTHKSVPLIQVIQQIYDWILAGYNSVIHNLIYHECDPLATPKYITPCKKPVDCISLSLKKWQLFKVLSLSLPFKFQSTSLPVWRRLLLDFSSPLAIQFHFRVWMPGRPQTLCSDFIISLELLRSHY